MREACRLTRRRRLMLDGIAVQNNVGLMRLARCRVSAGVSRGADAKRGAEQRKAAIKTGLRSRLPVVFVMAGSLHLRREFCPKWSNATVDAPQYRTVLFRRPHGNGPQSPINRRNRCVIRTARRNTPAALGNPRRLLLSAPVWNLSKCQSETVGDHAGRIR